MRQIKANHKIAPSKKGVYSKEPEYIYILRDWRARNNLTQADAASKLGMIQQTYSNMENRRTKLSVDFIKLFKEATGIDLIKDPESRPISINGNVPAKIPDIDCGTLQMEVQAQKELIESLKGQIESLKETIKLLRDIRG